MKIRRILFLLLAIALVGCSQHTEFKRELDRAEALMQEHPDSAYRVLCGMDGRADSVSTSLRMRHLLLRSNAQNKAAVPFTSDSIGTLLAEYYDSHGTPNERMLAHYMQGCAYRDMGDWPAALRCFNDAVAAADTAAADCNFNQLSIIYGQIGYLYDNLYLIDEALQAYNNAELYAPDTLCMLNFRDHKAGALEKKGEINHALKLMEEISNQYKTMGYSQYAAQTKGVCIKLFSRQGNFSKAADAMSDYENYSGYFLPNRDILHGREVYYYTKGVYYEEIEEVDSAEYYFRKLQRLGATLNDQYLASLGLTRLYRAQQQADSVAKYAWQTFQYSDSLYDENVAQNMQQAQAMHNYSQHQEVAFKKSIEAKEAQIWLRNAIIAGITLFFAAVLSLLTYLRRLRQKMARLKRKMRTRLTQNSAVADKLNGEISEKTRLISLEKPFPFDPFGQTGFAHLGHNKIDPIES